MAKSDSKSSDRAESTSSAAESKSSGATSSTASESKSSSSSTSSSSSSSTKDSGGLTASDREKIASRQNEIDRIKAAQANIGKTDKPEVFSVDLDESYGGIAPADKQQTLQNQFYHDSENHQKDLRTTVKDLRETNNTFNKYNNSSFSALMPGGLPKEQKQQLLDTVTAQRQDILNAFTEKGFNTRANIDPNNMTHEDMLARSYGNPHLYIDKIRNTQDDYGVAQYKPGAKGIEFLTNAGVTIGDIYNNPDMTPAEWVNKHGIDEFQKMFNQSYFHETPGERDSFRTGKARNPNPELYKDPVNVAPTTRPSIGKADSLEASDNSSYNFNSPSSGGYTNNSVSSAADKQYKRTSRNSESIGLADDPNRANYNDDWNRGMTDKSTDIVSDESKKTFVKKVIKRDPLNRTITKKIIEKRGQ